MMDFRKYISLLLLTTITLCLTSLQADAQRDTTGTAARTDSIIEYLTPLEYAFMMHEKTRFMLRVPVIGVGAEVEVLPYFTVMAQILYRQDYLTTDWGPAFNGEIRWYYGSRKKGIRNLSGNYFALGYERRSLLNTTGFPEYDMDSNLFYGRWGVQRRFLGNGLIDFGVNAGFVQTSLKDQGTGVYIQTTAQVGLGLVFNNESSLDADKICPVIKCYEKETFLLKLNTTNLFSIYHSTTLGNYRINFQPEIGIEQKLFDTPFSLGVDGKLNYNLQKSSSYSGDNYKSNGGTFSGRIQSRYYYNLKNRIRKGKSGNGLSANYFSAGYMKEYYFFRQADYKYFRKNSGLILITTGVQRTFGKHFFFDLELGGEFSVKYSSLDFYGNIQLGIKF